MTPYDLCLTWNWEHDAGFLDLLHRACTEARVSLLQVTPSNLASTVERLRAGEIGFHHLLDRSSEDDPRFLAIVRWAQAHGARSLNDYEAARRTWNKATMHRVIFSQVSTPYTIILPPYRETPELAELDLSPLGGSFTIKPANGGGGAGVVVAAVTREQVCQARREFPEDEYLLQTRVLPASLDGRPGWFRVIYCCGEAFPCWWGTDSHVYSPVTVAQETHYGLQPLRRIVEQMAAICGLQLFSSEVALSTGGEFLLVDYANDPVDLRLQSRCAEGVPDEIVRFIAENLARVAGAR